MLRGLSLIHQGKVRDTYAIPGRDDLLLVVASDRVSTHNIVHASEIPGKGEILTAITVGFMKKLAPVQTHLVASGKSIYNYLPNISDLYPTSLYKRAIVVKRLDMIPIEFIFRSRLAGSLWKSYSSGEVKPYGTNLPKRLELMSDIRDDNILPMFTPTDKSEHDDPLEAAEVELQYPEAYKMALGIYMMGCIWAKARGIEIIDGKFEIGVDPKTGEMVLADECLTPDSCRFVRSEDVCVGLEPPWMDKQILRNEAERVWGNNQKHPLVFSSEACLKTIKIYKEIKRILQV